MNLNSLAVIPLPHCNTLPITSRDSSPGTPTFGGGAQGSLLRDGSLPKDGSLYKDGSITSCLQAAFQAQLEEEDQQHQVSCPFHCCFQWPKSFSCQSVCVSFDVQFPGSCIEFGVWVGGGWVLGKCIY